MDLLFYIVYVLGNAVLLSTTILFIFISAYLYTLIKKIVDNNNFLTIKITADLFVKCTNKSAVIYFF